MYTALTRILRAALCYTGRVRLSRTNTAAALAVAVAAVIAAAPGCKSGADLRALCDGVERCIGGNDRDVDACADEGRLGEETADLKGCGDEFDAYAKCVLENGECTEARTSTFCSADADCTAKGLLACRTNQCTTKSYGPKDGTCATEKTAYAKCNGGTGGLLR